MKMGKPLNLLKYLSEEKEFGLTEQEMNELLNPADYIGRSEKQVEAFLLEVKPYIANVERTTAEISL